MQRKTAQVSMNSAQASALLMDSSAITEAIDGIAAAIVAEFLKDGRSELAFIGIQRHGVILARRIVEAIRRRTGFEPPVGSLDITMYRDDIGMRKSLPVIQETVIPFEMDRRAIILVDDVLQTGRTIRAALDAITDYGRPSLIRLAILIDRGLREFPIGADYIGSIQRVPGSHRIAVKLKELDGYDTVVSIANPNTAAGIIP